MVGALVLLVAVVAAVGYYQTKAALDAAEAALQQEGQFRLALAETPAFERRKEAVVAVAQDRILLKLWADTIRETMDLRGKLNDPDLDPQDRKKLKADLRSHDVREQLQERLKELRKLQNRAEPVYNWFLLDSKGLLVAREPARPEFIGDNFAWRTYFHGGDRDYDDLQDYLNNAAGEHVRKPHLSAALESPSAGGPLWAISAPVTDHDGKFVGVVGLRIRIGPSPR